MINGKEFLIRKYGKELVEKENHQTDDRLCLCCKHVIECKNVKDHTVNCENYKIDDKLSILNMVVRLLKTGTEENVIEANDIINCSYNDYNISLYDVYIMDYEYNPCEECCGTGILIGTGICQCDKCAGTGLIRKDHTDEHLCSLRVGYPGQFYFIGHYYDGIKDIMDVYPDINKELQNEPPISMRLVAYIKDKYFIHHKKDVYDSSTGVVIKQDNGMHLNSNDFILINKKSFTIESMGDYKHIHEELNIPYYMDLEYILGEKYEILPKEEFNTKYKIFPTEDNVILNKDMYDELRFNLIKTELFRFSEDIYSSFILVRSYLGKYNTLPKIEYNIYSYISSYTNPVNVDKDLVLTVLYDAHLIGINISKYEAGIILALLLTKISNIDVIKSYINSFNAIVVFIVEYIYWTERDELEKYDELKK